jgi:hypothetical protein
MRLTAKLVVFSLLAVLFVSSPAFAQQPRVVDAAAMSQALADRVGSESAQREQVRRVLDRADVREMAARMGLGIERADSAVATLTGAELGTLAQQASAVEAEALAGGANTIVISVTTLLLILIIVILLAK